MRGDLAWKPAFIRRGQETAHERALSIVRKNNKQVIFNLMFKKEHSKKRGTEV
jgi:hypothetical protein